LQIYFSAVIIILLAVTIYASLNGFSGHSKNVFIGYEELWAQPWGIATLFDAYFAFSIFWIWVAYKESRWFLKIFWLLMIYALGNFAISGYMLIQLARLKEDEDFHDLLSKKN
jgi:hypothetical protein